MEAAAGKGESRKKRRREPQKKEKKQSHFHRVHRGGYDESQIICYLWDIVKSLEAGRKTGQLEYEALEKRLRCRIRVEMRRYFTVRKNRNLKYLFGALGLVAGVILLFGFVIGIDRVSGNSMYPYLNHGDWIVYYRLSGEIRRDEVIAFEKDGESVVKRVAGLPGDEVEISASGGRVVVNGVQVRETYVTLPDTSKEAAGDEMGGPLTVMDGQYFMLGDNRGVSIDSRDRTMGTVPAEDVLGRVVLVVRAGG